MRRLFFHIDVEQEDMKAICGGQEQGEPMLDAVNDGYGPVSLHSSNDVALDLHAMLFPERYPPGDPHHDPDHVYWDGQSEEDNPAEMEEFQWSTETIEWVATALSVELADHPEAHV